MLQNANVAKCDTFDPSWSSSPGKDVDPELLAKRTTTLATEIVQAYAHRVDPGGEELKAEDEESPRA